MVTQIHSLVRESADPELYLYVLNNLDLAGNPMFIEATAPMEMELRELYFKPLQARRAGDFARTKRLENLIQAANFFAVPLTKTDLNFTLGAADFLVWKKQVDKQLEKYFLDILKHKKDQDQALLDFWDGLLKQSEDELVGRLADPIPWMRKAAIHAIAKKRIHKEDILIDLLGDVNPTVREAARDALIVLSRGNDFGPPPQASSTQLEVARQRWRQWYTVQEFPSRK